MTHGPPDASFSFVARYFKSLPGECAVPLFLKINPIDLRICASALTGEVAFGHHFVFHYSKPPVIFLPIIIAARVYDIQKGKYFSNIGQYPVNYLCKQPKIRLVEIND
jgi:hypothetical protein